MDIFDNCAIGQDASLKWHKMNPVWRGCRKYWGVDENSVVFVADPNFGNILNFNVGSNIDVQVPPNFWTRLSSTLSRTLGYGLHLCGTTWMMHAACVMHHENMRPLEIYPEGQVAT